jgi:hypothetical protein
MKKNKVRIGKPEDLKPLESKIISEDIHVKIGTSERIPEPVETSPEPQVTITEPIPKQPPKFIRLEPFESFILIYTHESICRSSGVCFCTTTDGRRMPKTLHVIAGIPVVIPVAAAHLSEVVSRKRRGKVLLKKV